MRKPDINKVSAYASFLTLILAFGAVFNIFYWLSYPYKPVDLKSVTITDEEVRAGDVLHYTIDYCKNINIPATVIRAFVNGIVFTTNSMITNNPVGCHTNKAAITVPPEMTSGSYSLRTTWIYKVNPVREVTVTRDSNIFTITGSDQDRQRDN